MIQNVYGMSESVGLTTCCTPAKNLFGTVGHCRPDQPVVPEEMQGELCYRGRHIMMGYMGNPIFGPEHIKDIEDKNSATIDSEGWLHSGDKGCMDTNGMVRITGRYK